MKLHLIRLFLKPRLGISTVFWHKGNGLFDIKSNDRGIFEGYKLLESNLVICIRVAFCDICRDLHMVKSVAFDPALEHLIPLHIPKGGSKDAIIV